MAEPVKVKVRLGDGTMWYRKCKDQAEAEVVLEDLKTLVGQRGRVTILKEVIKPKEEAIE